MSQENMDKSTARYGQTKRGRAMLIDWQNFCYTKNDSINDRTYWKCVERDARKCRARASTMPDGKINSLSGEHNHLSDIVGLRVKAKERELQTKAIEDPRINPRAAFADLASSLKTPSEVAKINAMGGLDFGNILNNPVLMNMAQSLLTDPNMQQMMGQFMSGGAAEGGYPTNMEGLLEAGQRLAEQMQQSNPELVEQLRRQMTGRDNGADPSQ